MIAQKKHYVQIVEITKTYASGNLFSATSGDNRASKQLQPRFCKDFYQLNLELHCAANAEVFEKAIDADDVIQRM